ncbi:MAG: hypothetical protein IT447_03350 [Phycisphaerales bacterium]|jgi:tetratricopeptide (TPR) repeat protein|nr:hypothetical protein [Phycisphaerales bacterium]
MSKTLSDLRGLPSRSSEVWQLVVIPQIGMKIPVGTNIIELAGCFIADQRTHQAMSFHMDSPDVPKNELACVCIVAGCVRPQTGYVPGVIQVRDPELATLINPMLEPYGIRVEVVDLLPAADEVVDSFKRDLLPLITPDWLDTPGGWLDAPGMTPKRLSAYAQAAAMMYTAAPWQYLASDDLIKIESPSAPDNELRFATVIGMSGKDFGISFFPNRHRFNQLLDHDDLEGKMEEESSIELIFEDADNLPVGDAQLWLAEKLPLVNDHAYPLLLDYLSDEDFDRLDGPSVTFVEGLCRALAQTSEQQIDSGRWEQTVETSDGPVTYVLSLPMLLEAKRDVKPKRTGMLDRRLMDKNMLAIELLMSQRKADSIEEMNEILAKELNGKVPVLPPPTSPLEQAQWLCFEAFEHHGRRRIQLAKEALDICPDAADAYCLLAENRGYDIAGANELFRQGMEAGRRALGEKPFEDPEYRFWGAIRSRPYMRARNGYAQTLLSLGRKQEAVEEFKALLKLNPNDNQGIRYQLAPLLLELNRLDDLDELLNEENFQDDGSAEWTYVRALLVYRRMAASPKARTELFTAIRSNPHVPKYLLGRVDLPSTLPRYFSYGDEDEAMIVASSQKTLWEQSPGALNWLSKCKRQLNQSSQRKKSRRKR